MKPFDLAAALAGEPVKLRDGDKAYVLKYLLNPMYNNNALIGYREFTDNAKEHPITWTVYGKYYNSSHHSLDIVGMWEEPKPTIKIGDIDVPEPEREPLRNSETYYVPVLSFRNLASSNTWDGVEFDLRRLERGLVHKTREAAEQHAKALLALTASEETNHDN